MKQIIKVVRVAFYEMKIIFFSGRFLIISIVSWVYLDMFISEIRKFALDYNLKMVPAVLPFYFSDSIYCNVAFLLLIFLLSGMPLLSGSQKQLLQRCGNCCWANGQMLAIVGIVAVFVLEQLLFSILALLPCLEFEGWGKVWGSIAENRLTDLGYSNYSSISEKILLTYQPWQAIFFSSILFWLTGICYGMILFLLNGTGNGKIGTALLSGWSLAWLVLQNMGGNQNVRFLMRYSPQSWCDLSNMNVFEAFYAGIYPIMVAIVLFFVNKKMVQIGRIGIK